MITDTEGIVLRQTKTVAGRRMILLFSRKFGKISVGTSAAEGGKNKSPLRQDRSPTDDMSFLRAETVTILNNGQVIKSYYGIGEDL